MAEGEPGLLALQADGLVTTPDRAGVCADLALALDPGEPEEPTRSNQGSGWTKDTAGY
ncbi:hypothetical protein ACQEU5_24990 [Marinactinospora thermotolerans]|uniref:hypothetical protein n=1 Tax=Marinactinospora thermotolerans TaxID=531310 RepID=UPI003D8A0500